MPYEDSVQMANRFRAFISYSHKDLRWAKWLHKSIESFHTPGDIVSTPTKLGPAPARLTPVFRDQDDLASSSDLSKEIKDALGRSEFLIVICSPASAASKWVDREIQTFKELGRPDRILCLLVDGDPSRPNTPYDPFPPSLRVPYDHRGFPQEGQAEPIAADPRRSGDGPLLAKQKILAGLLGVGLDRLRRREYIRRQRRMLAITVASVSVTLLTSLLALFALNEKRAAQQSRDHGNHYHTEGPFHIVGIPNMHRSFGDLVRDTEKGLNGFNPGQEYMQLSSLLKRWLDFIYKSS